MKAVTQLILLMLPILSYGQDIFQAQKIVASDRAISDRFGVVSISGNYMVVGANNEDEDETGGNTLDASGAAYIFEKDGSGTWVEVQKIVASDRAKEDRFGGSTAISGNYIVVGASGQDTDELGENTVFTAGAIYVYKRDSGGTWNEVQKLVASDRSTGDLFGGSGISIFGNYLIVSTIYDDEDASGANTLNNSGAVYIFERDESGIWSEIQKIVASDRAANDYFGSYISMSQDYLVVGAYNEDEDANGANTLNGAGSAYVFEQNESGIWEEVQKLVSSDRNTADNFGRNVDISEDYIVVSASGEDEDATGGNTLAGAGSVYVFERDGNGIWNELQKIVPNDRGAGDFFGGSIAIDGNRFVVGAAFEDEDASGSGTLNNSGAAYVFERDENGSWNQEQKIVAGDRLSGDLFGTHVGISGGHIVVATIFDDKDANGTNILSDAGSAYIFDRNSITYSAGVWSGGSGSSGEPTIADGGKKIVISDGSPILTEDAEVNDLVIEFGATLTIPSDKSLTVLGSTTLEDIESLIIKSDENNTGNLLCFGELIYNNGATVKIERYIPASNFYLDYHYIGTPINSHTTFNDMTDLYAYNESDLLWVHHEDPVDGFDNFNNGVGYAINYGTATTASFVGEINSSNYSVGVTSTDHGGNIYEGFNLISNPYPCSISAESFVTENSSIVSNNLFFWNGVDYAVYNTGLSNGTAGALGVAPDGNIALGQAFFVEANTTGSINIKRTMRGTDSDIFHKKLSFPQLRLVIYNDEAKSDVLLTGYQFSNTEKDEYDGKQLLSDHAVLALGSLLDDSVYDIESVPTLSGHIFDLVVRSVKNNEITFKLEDMIQLDGKSVYLEDREKNIVIDLTKELYKTSVFAGEDKNRFKLHVNDTRFTYSLWINQGKVNLFKNGTLLEGSVRLYGLDGKIISTTKSNYINNWSSLPCGVYLLDFHNDYDTFTSKIIKH